MSTEYRLVTFSRPTQEVVPSEVGRAAVLALDVLGAAPELAERLEGWDVVSVQVIPADEVTYVSVFLQSKPSLPPIY